MLILVIITNQIDISFTNSQTIISLFRQNSFPFSFSQCTKLYINLYKYLFKSTFYIIWKSQFFDDTADVIYLLKYYTPHKRKISTDSIDSENPLYRKILKCNREVNFNCLTFNITLVLIHNIAQPQQTIGIKFSSHFTLRQLHLTISSRVHTLTKLPNPMPI